MDNETRARAFCESIYLLIENDNLDNFESYLSYHFEEWFNRFVLVTGDTPATIDNLISEVNHFANID